MRVQEENYEASLKETKKALLMHTISLSICFTLPSFYTLTGQQRWFNIGDKVDIVPHTVMLYTEFLGTIKIEFLPLTSLDTKARKRVLKSSAFKSVFTEQESDNKRRRLFTSRMLFSCSHFMAFVKTNASNFFP